jgi:hypothetical protein
VVGAFPDGQSALNLAAARLRHIAGNRMVGQEIFEHRAAEGPADERCHHRLSQDWEPLSPNRMCEKLWTLPFQLAARPTLRWFPRGDNVERDQFESCPVGAWGCVLHAT